MLCSHFKGNISRAAANRVFNYIPHMESKCLCYLLALFPEKKKKTVAEEKLKNHHHLIYYSSRKHQNQN